MKALIMMMGLMISITANAIENRTQTTINGECSAICEVMSITVKNAVQEASLYMLSQGVDVDVRFRYKTAQMVVIADSQKEARGALALLRNKTVRNIMLANNVQMNSWAILGVGRDAFSKTLVNIDGQFYSAYAGGDYIGYGNAVSNRTHYCYFYWQGKSIFRTTYSSFNECIKKDD